MAPCCNTNRILWLSRKTIKLFNSILIFFIDILVFVQYLMLSIVYDAKSYAASIDFLYLLSDLSHCFKNHNEYSQRT